MAGKSFLHKHVNCSPLFNSLSHLWFEHILFIVEMVYIKYIPLQKLHVHVAGKSYLHIDVNCSPLFNHFAFLVLTYFNLFLR